MRCGCQQPEVRDALYVIRCLGQFQYAPLFKTKEQAHRSLEVLQYGLLQPLEQKQEEEAEEPKDQRRRELLVELASQLRINQRQGVVPLLTSIMLVLVSFAIACYSAFADVGDYTTAHSLAMGLLILWFPMLILFSAIDDVPNDPVRTQFLLEEWMRDLDTLLYKNDAEVPAEGEGPFLLEPISTHELGPYVGQGRSASYLGLCNALIIAYEAQHKRACAPMNSYSMFKLITSRPSLWWAMLIISQFIVFSTYVAGFLISFHTGTVGLGCRSFAYTIWWIFTHGTLPVQLLPPKLPFMFAQERRRSVTIGRGQMLLDKIFHKNLPEKICNVISRLSRSVAFCVIIFIIFCQTTGVLNSCWCRASKFSSYWGGYVILGSKNFFISAFHVDRWWILGVGIGGGWGFALGMIALSTWLTIRKP